MAKKSRTRVLLRAGLYRGLLEEANIGKNALPPFLLERAIERAYWACWDRCEDDVTIEICGVAVRVPWDRFTLIEEESE